MDSLFFGLLMIFFDFFPRVVVVQYTVVNRIIIIIIIIMATSSRWKRFAFFERKNLSLPPSVVRDLIPTTTTTTTTSSATNGSRDDRGGGGDKGKTTTTTSAARSSSSRKHYHVEEDEDQYPHQDDGIIRYPADGPPDVDETASGEYFSLVAASNVMLPPSLFSSRREAAAAASSSSSPKGIGDSNNKNQTGNDDELIDGDALRGGLGATRRGAGGDGAAAMHAGLMAISSSSSSSSSSGNGFMTRGREGEINDNGLQLLFVSSRHTSHVHCVDVTVRCTPSNPLYSTTTTNTATNTTTTGAQSLPNGNDRAYPHDDDNDMGRRRGSNSNIDFSSSTNAFASSSLSSPNRGLLQDVPSKNNNYINNMNPGAMSTANLEELDGWRGHYNPFAPCGGGGGGDRGGDRATVGGAVPGGGRATTSTFSSKPPPPPPAPRQQALTSSTSAATTSSNTSRRRTAAEQRILEEHLGSSEDIPRDTASGGAGGKGGAGSSGGSLFGSSPFAAGDVRVEDSTRRITRIVGLATTTYHHPLMPPPPNNSNNNNKSQSESHTSPSPSSLSSILYVAAITDNPNTAGLVVHANPHLMLSSSLPPPPSSSTLDATTNSTVTARKLMNSCYYKPSSFDFTTRGNPRCVSMLPGVVCVGTDIGVVLIYVFNCNLSPESIGGNCVPTAAAAGGGVKGGELILVAEIPAPRSNIISDNEHEDGGEKISYAVSSVHLVVPVASSNSYFASGRVGNSSTAGIASKMGGYSATSSNIYRLFVSYRKRRVKLSAIAREGPNNGSLSKESNNLPSSSSSGGVSCYELGGLRIPGKLAQQLPAGLSTNSPVVSARYDLDVRDVRSNCLCDGIRLPTLPPAALWKSTSSTERTASNSGARGSATDGSAVEERTNDVKLLPQYAVARNDALHFYSPEDKVGVCPIDGNKIAICALPSPLMVYLRRPLRPLGLTGDGGDHNGIINGAGASYALVAATDPKSERDSIDVYDTVNKLVGFHVLLSPGHRALRAVGLVSSPAVGSGKLVRGGRSSAIVLTSGGSIVSMTEKITPDKVDLLTQKNLYAAAISMAFSDPQFYSSEDVVALYRRYAEHLYRTGDFAAAMDQYILTIGSLESSHVIIRFLDSTKISLAVKYLEALRVAGLASSVHNELLRTCYLKLGDADAASRTILESSSSRDVPALNPDGTEVPIVSISRNLLARADNPSEMLAAICSLHPPEAVKALVAHGVLIARSLPRETAGV